jgi:hypothetical protein
LPTKIRPIELVKHNPNLFHVELFDLNAAYGIAGGAATAATTSFGALFGYWYYNQKSRHQPANFYASIFLSFSRVALGAAVGGWVGYAKFGDR